MTFTTNIKEKQGIFRKFCVIPPAKIKYILYIDKVRNYAKAMPTRDAVNRAVNECIREGILADFLKKYKAEAIEVSIFEYDEAAHMSHVLEEGRAEGDWLRLISQIRKKLNKNIAIEQIADMLEENEKTVKELISLIEKNPQKVV